MFGFSYRGIHSSRFGVYYIPDATDRGQDMPAFDVEDLDIGHGDGGLYVQNRVPARDLPLDCYFDGITQDMREGLYRWLHRDTKGPLVYDDRMYAYYDVRPVKRIEIKEYQHRT